MEIALRDLRLQSSGTVRMTPVGGRAWRQWQDVREPLEGPMDEDWAEDRVRLDEAVRDPFPSASTNF